MSTSILITTDLSEGSVSAIRYGVEHGRALAKSCENSAPTIRVLQIVPPFDLPLVLQRQLSSPESLKELEETYNGDAKQRLTDFLEGLHLTSPVTSDIVFSDEPPSREIIKYAQEKGVDLIVMASQGKGAVGKLFLGSTTQKVAGRTPCPILIIPPEGNH